MKRKIIIGVVAVVIVLIGFSAYRLVSSRNLSPEAAAEYNQGGVDVHIHYCQPSKRGRLIFGSQADGALVPFGEKWRTGANAATEIHVGQNLLVNGEPLEAGSYSVYTIPGPDQWTVVFNGNLDYWGASLTGSDVYDESADVLRVDVPATESSTESETFTIDFQEYDGGATLRLRWDRTEVKIPIRAA